MAQVELNDIFFAEIAGWDMVKAARLIVAGGRVLSSSWEPPLLKGVVQQGTGTLNTGLIIRDAVNVDNLCKCRTARERGIICEHAVAVGLHWVRGQQPAPVATPNKSAADAVPAKPVKRLRRATGGEQAEPAAIHILLPPNFGQAAAKGKVMLCFEAEWRKGRTPLNALPLDEPFTFDAADAALLDPLEAIAGEPPALAMLTTAQFADLLPALAGHPRVTLGKSQGVEVRTDPLPLAVSARLQSTGEIQLSLADAAPTGLLRGGSVWVFEGTTLQPVTLPESLNGIFSGPIKIPRSRVPMFLNLDWPKLVAGCDLSADFTVDDFGFEPAPARFTLHLAGGLAMLNAKLDCFYGDRRVAPGVAAKDETAWLPDPDSPTRYRTRNLAAEQAAIARLTRHGFIGPDAQGCWNVKGQDAVLGFFAREFPHLEKEWQVTLEERLERSTGQNMERVEPQFAVTSSGEQWFDLSVNYQTTGGDRLSAADVQQLLLSGRGIGKSKRGKFLLIDTGAVEELQQVLLEASPQQHGGGYRLDHTQAGFVEASLRQQGWSAQAPLAWRDRVAQRRGELQPALPPLGDLESVLRPYQKDGVGWLYFLRANGFGGILADEMGLGKTLQVLALLATRKAVGGPVPTLVVCPTSLVHNWAAEAAKFTPQLRVLELHGPRRQELFAQMPSHDLVITSYALLRRDFDIYRDLEFDTVVLDEAQHIKNRQTQNAQAVKALRSRHRLVLTGTPIENSVLDLWSLFDFLMPGYLGAATDFRERYEIPITRTGDAALQDRLARRVRPFIRRRLKREVATDLPEKLEQVSYCELSEEQRAVYQQLLEAGRREVFAAVETNGVAKSRMVVLTTLLRLRQVCCDLRLLRMAERSEGAERSGGVMESWSDGKASAVAGLLDGRRDARPTLGAGEGERMDDRRDARPAAASGKVELFGELLDEILDGGHRALVFSQFTTMLGLLREKLDADAVPYCYLDGGTKNRAEVVEKFQREGGIPIFLISLKAGGTGLNLTGADTVIHFDPWWNPAVEAQATDRAHRIGQSRVVTSYKLIVRDTVEEKILNLQARKQALTQGALGGEESLVGALDWEEITELLTG